MRVELSEENAAELRDALAPFVGAARRSGTRRWPSAPLQRGWWLAAVTVTLRLAYLVLGRVLSWLLLLARSDRGWGVAY